MKTLREHLLERSREAAPERELAAMRERVAKGLRAGAAVHGASASGGTLGLMRTLWRELVWPCRGVWATIAAGWVVVLALNHSGRAGASGTLTQDDMVVLQALWREQRNLVLMANHALPAPSQKPREGEGASGSKPLGMNPEPGSGMRRVFLSEERV